MHATHATSHRPWHAERHARVTGAVTLISHARRPTLYHGEPYSIRIMSPLPGDSHTCHQGARSQGLGSILLKAAYRFDGGHGGGGFKPATLWLTRPAPLLSPVPAGLTALPSNSETQKRRGFIGLRDRRRRQRLCGRRRHTF